MDKEKLTIFTLNVDGFSNSQRGIKELKRLVDDLISNNRNIIILQEIPHKIYNKQKQPWSWDNNCLFELFKEEFKNYKVIFPKHLIDSNKCTVAICKEDSEWKEISREKIRYDKQFNYGNKLVEVQYSDKMTMLGLHMNPCNDMWDLLLNSERKNNHTFIVGDFNAYEYRGEMQKKPIDLRNMGFNSLISSNIITCFKTKASIDNFYVSKGFDFEKGIAIKIEDVTNKFKTDHALCSVEFYI